MSATKQLVERIRKSTSAVVVPIKGGFFPAFHVTWSSESQRQPALPLKLTAASVFHYTGLVRQYQFGGTPKRPFRLARPLPKTVIPKTAPYL